MEKGGHCPTVVVLHAFELQNIFILIHTGRQLYFFDHHTISTMATASGVRQNTSRRRRYAEQSDSRLLGLPGELRNKYVVPPPAQNHST